MFYLNNGCESKPFAIVLSFKIICFLSNWLWMLLCQTGSYIADIQHTCNQDYQVSALFIALTHAHTLGNINVCDRWQLHNLYITLPAHNGVRLSLNQSLCVSISIEVKKIKKILTGQVIHWSDVKWTNVSFAEENTCPQNKKKLEMTILRRDDTQYLVISVGHRLQAVFAWKGYVTIKQGLLSFT